MAFTVVGERHFLGSGHPDRREDLPPHLDRRGVHNRQEPKEVIMRPMGVSTSALIAALTTTAAGLLVACDSQRGEPGSMKSEPGYANLPRSDVAPSDTPAARGERDLASDRLKQHISNELLATFTVDQEAGDSGSRRLVLTTHGSSSCPWRVTDVATMGARWVVITVSEGYAQSQQPCTADDAPLQHWLELPSGVRPEQITTAWLLTADDASARVTVGPRAG